MQSFFIAQFIGFTDCGKAQDIKLRKPLKKPPAH